MYARHKLFLSWLQVRILKFTLVFALILPSYGILPGEFAKAKEFDASSEITYHVTLDTNDCVTNDETNHVWVDDVGTHPPVKGCIREYLGYHKVLVRLVNQHEFWTKVSLIQQPLNTQMSNYDLWSDIGYIPPQGAADYLLDFTPPPNASRTPRDAYVKFFVNGAKSEDERLSAPALTVVFRVLSALPIDISKADPGALKGFIDILAELIDIAPAIDALAHDQMDRFAEELIQLLNKPEVYAKLVILIQKSGEQELIRALGAGTLKTLIRKAVAAVSIYFSAKEARDTFLAIWDGSIIGTVQFNSRFVPSGASNNTATSTPMPCMHDESDDSIYLDDFEKGWCWKRADQNWGEFTLSSEKAFESQHAGKFDYKFPANAGNKSYLAYERMIPLLDDPTILVMEVNGDGSGNYLNARVVDAKGREWQFTFGQVNHTGWLRMGASFDLNRGWPNGPIGGDPSDRTLTYPLKLRVLIIDGIHDGVDQNGVIFIDNLSSGKLVGATPQPSPTPANQPSTPHPANTPVPATPIAPAISFGADRTSINTGECVTLRWDVDNVREVYLDERGVTGHGSQQVCPTAPQTYKLTIVRQGGGREERTVTIEAATSGDTSEEIICGQFIWICDRKWPAFLPAGSKEPWIIDQSLVFDVFTEGSYASLDSFEFSNDQGAQCGYPNVKYMVNVSSDFRTKSSCEATQPTPTPLPPPSPADSSQLRGTLLGHTSQSGVPNTYSQQATQLIDILLAHLDEFQLSHLGITRQTMTDALNQEDVGDRINGIVQAVWGNWADNAKQGGFDANTTDPDVVTDMSPFRKLLIRMIQGRQGRLEDTEQHALHNFFTRAEESHVWRDNINGVIGAVNRESFQWQ